MATDHRAELKKIRTFPSLVRYLRDEMGWPIESDDFEELTFDYTAEELGIDIDSAARIQEIKRLRPLSPSQPWGIFFVKFEPKRLPVVALRRILGQVVLKKRATAKAAERVAWAVDDLLFVSNYGLGDARQITFAHFSQNEARQDLPTLSVLGWDNLDTLLHLDEVAEKLTRGLSWPKDEKNLDAWRQQWRSAFTQRHREVITTSKALAVRLAELARDIRDRIKTVLAIETDKGPVTKLMTAFREALVHDLDANGFADMYAQTIAYGLLSARIADPASKTAHDFASHMRTNPFLRELMETFLKIGGRRGKAGGLSIDFDELGVSDVMELLDDANMEAVVRDFGDRNPQEDPVIHFYEGFAEAYDPIDKVRRGEFYTPRQVVSYIVRSVDELLRTEFGLEDGLADTTSWAEMAKRHAGLEVPDGVAASQAFVQILDPATGTGTFLIEVIELIHKTLATKWKAQGHSQERIKALWNEYVPRHLLPRLHAYELKMAPYAIAHLKIGLKLYETGYRFVSSERAQVYLTNALEPAQEFSDRLSFDVPALAHEARAVNQIKRQQRFTVVIGNPPYAGHSANNNDWIGTLVGDYYFVNGQALGERTAKWLQDDYVKFIRFGQYLLQQSSAGILGYITNHGYLDNPTFRGMRASLIGEFTSLRILDLHGNLKKRERAPDGGPDENVFDIQPGVAICLLSRCAAIRRLLQADLFGTRSAKYGILQESSVGRTEWEVFEPAEPFFVLYPQDTDLREEFGNFWKSTDVFPLNGVGMTTARDHVVIDFEREPLLRRVTAFRDSKAPNRELCREFNIPEKKGWNVTAARSALRSKSELSSLIVGVAYRPFDDRVIFYHDSLVWRTVRKVMKHMLGGKNLGLAVGRAGQVIDQGEWNLAFVTRKITEFNLYRRGGNNLAPLYVYPDSEHLELTRNRVPNLAPRFLRELATRLGLPQGNSNSMPEGLIPEDVFHCIYAILFSPGYRNRYSEFLKIDFPRVPVPTNLQLFRDLARRGSELVALHLLEWPKLADVASVFIGGRSPNVEKISWSHQTVWIDTAQTTGFKGVPQAVWKFSIGGHQVCEKWLKDRKGRTLSRDDVAHYQRIIVALSETIRLMAEIDKVIEQYGGWPRAFTKPEEAGIRAPADSEPLPRSEGPRYRHQADLLPQRKVAEPEDQPYGPDVQHENCGSRQHRDELDREDLICRIRQLFVEGGERERESAIDDMARELGYQHTGVRIHDKLDNALRTAVRRGILSNEQGVLRLFVRTIEQYDREFLKEQFLASLSGRQWVERDDAIRDFARWMGFKRTGAAIDDTARSLINGLLREERLARSESRIRRIG
jgi:hypothetical protein